jgi:hypothetical protein
MADIRQPPSFAVVLAVAIYASTRAAVPDPLPGVALGWTALFHVERAGAVLGAIGVVVLIAWRALSGNSRSSSGMSSTR